MRAGCFLFNATDKGHPQRLLKQKFKIKQSCIEVMPKLFLCATWTFSHNVNIFNLFQDDDNATQMGLDELDEWMQVNLIIGHCIEAPTNRMVTTGDNIGPVICLIFKFWKSKFMVSSLHFWIVETYNIRSAFWNELMFCYTKSFYTKQLLYCIW